MAFAFRNVPNIIAADASRFDIRRLGSTKFGQGIVSEGQDGRASGVIQHTFGKFSNI